MRVERSSFAFTTAKATAGVARGKYCAAWRALINLKNRYDQVIEMGPEPSATVLALANLVEKERMGLELIEVALTWLSEHHEVVLAAMDTGVMGGAPGDATTATAGASTVVAAAGRTIPLPFSFTDIMDQW